MSKLLSKYKFKRFAEKSLENTLRLHYDSILLFNNESYPSAYHLSVLALEEFAKTKMIDHYYYTSITNEGFPDLEFEQQWLKLLYYHPKKQFSFVGRELFEYTPTFVKFIKQGKLELKKQQAVYVGLNKIKDKVDTTSRISIPNKKIKKNDPKQIISLINRELSSIFEINKELGDYWGIEILNKIVNCDEYSKLQKWKFKTKLKK